MAKKKNDAQPTGPIHALFIRSKSKAGFRRCGFEFNAEGYGIALDALTDEQIQILRAEPKLIVQDTEIDVAELSE